MKLAFGTEPMTDDAAPAQIVQPRDQLEFYYIKINFFRVIYAEGAFGGVSPRGMITFAFYNERGPIPRRTAVNVIDGVPQFGNSPSSNERVIEARPGIVREVEAEIMMSIEGAEAFHRWLGEKLQLHHQVLRSAISGRGGDGSR